MSAEATERRKAVQRYRAYYTRRTPEESREERDLVAEWRVSGAEAWARLEDEETSSRRPPRKRPVT